MTIPPAPTGIAAVARIEHGERTVEAAEHHFRRVALGTLLIGPLAGPELALEVHLRPLAQILLGDLAQALGEDDDTVPFGSFTALAGVAIAPSLCRGNGKVHDRLAIIHVPHVGVAPEIADQDDLVHTPRHTPLPNPVVFGIITNGSTVTDIRTIRPAKKAVDNSPAEGNAGCRQPGVRWPDPVISLMTQPSSQDRRFSTVPPYQFR